jgi:hypothetical protein
MIPAMSQRTWTFFFTGLLAVWFAVVIPAHERGEVALPGTQGSGGGDSCCPVKPADDGPPCHDDGSDRDPVRRCALCQFVGTLDVAAPLIIDLPPAQLVALHNEYRPVDPAAACPFGPHQSRAPPA